MEFIQVTSFVSTAVIKLGGSTMMKGIVLKKIGIKAKPASGFRSTPRPHSLRPAGTGSPPLPTEHQKKNSSGGGTGRERTTEDARHVLSPSRCTTNRKEHPGEADGRHVLGPSRRGDGSKSINKLGGKKNRAGKVRFNSNVQFSIDL